MASNIFSDSWHLVADLKVSLIHSVESYKQFYRGDIWYVLNDKFSSKFYRVTPKAYKFLMKLDINRTVEEIWEKSLLDSPELTPNQNDVVRILSQLHLNNLLYSKNKFNVDSVFSRFSEVKQKEIKGKIASFLFIKIPLWNPEKWLENNKKLIHIIFSKVGFIVWAFFLIFALKEVFDNSQGFLNQTQGMLSVNNLVYLYVALVFLKVFHEMGHAMVAKRFGGSVTTMGVSIIIFTPLPYMDASSSWVFQNRFHRAFVGAAGMFVELFIAAIAAIIWVNTGDGTVNSVAFNMMIMGSITSIFFNGNPLLKFDSYYILSDLLEIPNLYNRSHQQIYYLIEKYVFSLQDLFNPSRSIKEAFWLVVYGVLSFLYKLIVSISIGIFVADQFFLLGVIVILLSIFMWIIKPTWKFLTYLFSNQKLRTKRFRVFMISSIFFLFFFILLFYIPFYNSIKAQGIVKAKSFENIYSPTESYINKIEVKNNTYVEKGDVLVSLSNKTLDFDIDTLNAQLLETNAMILQAIEENIANLKPLYNRLESLKEKLQILKEKKESLKILATIDGVWFDNKLQDKKYSLVKQRELLGKIIVPDSYQFIGVVTQDKASDLFLLEKDDIYANIKLYGIAHLDFDVFNVNIIPYEKNYLPSAVLGFAAGGDIAVDRSDESGLKSLESFFEIKVDINSKNIQYLYHDRSGVLKIELPLKPLGTQFTEFVEKLLQKRYKI